MVQDERSIIFVRATYVFDYSMIQERMGCEWKWDMEA